MLNAVDCNFGFQAREALVGFNLLESLFDRGLGCVRGKGFEDRIGRVFVDRADYGLDRFRPACEEGDGEVAVLGRGEDSGDSRALQYISDEL